MITKCPKCGSPNLQDDVDYTPGGVADFERYPPEYWQYTFCHDCDWRSDKHTEDDAESIPF